MENQLDALTTVFTEFYYWITIVLMFLIHVGFCLYEPAASRRRNHLHTLMKTTMHMPVVTIAFFVVGWWVYWAMPNGPGITGGIEWEAAAPYLPWSENMGANVSDRATGVLWGAFLLFGWTAASILSGSVIERIRSGAFWIHAAVLGGLLWILASSWGWHPEGWMVKLLGYHDAYCAGVIHALAGGYALGVLSVLGPRLGKFTKAGKPRNIPPHNTWLATLGLFSIYVGFWGFYVACNIPLISPEAIGGEITGVTWTATNIYLAPTSLSAITFNFMMALSGGLMGGYIASKGDPFWTYSCGLAGIIAASAGNDFYHPMQALLIGGIVSWAVYKLHFWVERVFKIDDVLGVAAVHGYAGCLSVVIAGFLLWGAPSAPFEGYAAVNPLGQFAGAVILFVGLGFIPGWLVSKLLAGFGKLRVPPEVELLGLDFRANEAYDNAIADVKGAETHRARQMRAAEKG